MTDYKTFDDYVKNTFNIEPRELTHISPEEQKKKTVVITVDELINIWNELTELKLKAGSPKWHKLDWEKDYPKSDRLVRVRTKTGKEYICETYDYMPAEDEIGYGTILTQFEQLDGDWVDDNEIKYWCYIEPFKE